jgi:hypothetical protein
MSKFEKYAGGGCKHFKEITCHLSRRTEMDNGRCPDKITSIMIDNFCTALPQVVLLTKLLSSTDINRVVVIQRTPPSPTSGVGYVANIRLQDSEDQYSSWQSLSREDFQMHEVVFPFISLKVCYD